MENNTLDKYQHFFKELNNYDKSLKLINKDFIYGTSGFRCDASSLHRVNKFF